MKLQKYTSYHQQIVSNINTPTYQLAKYLAKLLSPLSQSDYIVKIVKHFIEQTKSDKIQEGCKGYNSMSNHCLQVYH